MTIRDVFERWAKAHDYNTFKNRKSDSFYFYPDTNAAFRGYQQGRKDSGAVLRQALKALDLVTPSCRDLHHCKKDRHELGEPCLALARHIAAIHAIKQHLGEV